ncbi:MAG: bifunctional oligoribonuclease/PAP phosphatase NrnA [Clostridia bacterium]|nr:bifunctional oligoribonuclease/PAP phosphatase NrnA [Clostridia bacterium]
MNINNDFKEIFSVINKYDNILIAGHKNPDGDCIGSCVSLGLLLTKMGKQVSIFIKDMPHEFKILKGTYLYTNKLEENYDLVVTLDCADDGRVEIKEQFKNAKETINIDHHKDNPMFATYNYVDENSSSVAEIMYDLYKANDVTLDKDIAEAIYVGIISDTALFQNLNTTEKTMNIAASLMKYNINFNKIIGNLFFSKTFTEMKLIGKAMDNAKVYHNGDIIVSTLTKEEIASLNAKSNETSSIISMIRQVEGTKIACFIYEPIPHNVKVSLRCDVPYDVCEIAQSIGGGGHILAAGAIVKNKPMEEVKKEVIDLMIEQIERYEN